MRCAGDLHDGWFHFFSCFSCMVDWYLTVVVLKWETDFTDICGTMKQESGNGGGG